MAFRVGQRVICVRETRSDDPAAILGANYPRKGEIVTVRAINVWPSGTLLRFFEHNNDHLIGASGKMEPGFNSTCFRPLDETRLDQFRVHLAPKPREVVEA